MEGNSGKQGGGTNPKQSGLSWSQPSSTQKLIQSSGQNASKGMPMSRPMPVAAAPAGGGRKLFMFFVGGIVIGGLLAWGWFSLVSDRTAMEEEGALAAGEHEGEVSSTGTQGSSTGSPALPGAVVSSEALVVPTPQDAGLSVMVSSASVTSPTWVVIYESSNGMRGNALGAALFFPQGGSKAVNLLRATEPGKTYFVGRHVDNGDKQFSLTTDKAVTNAAGNPIYAEFRTR